MLWSSFKFPSLIPKFSFSEMSYVIIPISYKWCKSQLPVSVLIGVTSFYVESWRQIIRPRTYEVWEQAIRLRLHCNKQQEIQECFSRDMWNGANHQATYLYWLLTNLDKVPVMNCFNLIIMQYETTLRLYILITQRALLRILARFTW